MMKLGGNSSSTQYQTVAQFSFARNGATITLGRDPACDVPVTGANVASVHARIKLGADAVRIVSDIDRNFLFSLSEAKLPAATRANEC